MGDTKKMTVSKDLIDSFSSCAHASAALAPGSLAKKARASGFAATQLAKRHPPQAHPAGHVEAQLPQP